MRNIRLKIKNDGSMSVSCDKNVPLQTINDFVISKQNRIAKVMKNLAEHNLKTNLLQNNSGISIWGENYKISVAKGCGGFAVKNSILELYPENADSEAEKDVLIMRFTAEKGRSYLSELVDLYYEKFLRITPLFTKISKPVISLKMLKSKWGHCRSCDGKNEIMLNLAMYKLPEYLSEYVVAHEIVHLAIKNHSNEFYSTGEFLYPNFKQADNDLRKFAITP